MIKCASSWLKFLGKNLRLVGCATVYAKSEVHIGKSELLVFSSFNIYINNSNMYFKPDFLLEVRDAMFICKCMNVLCQITVRNADKKSYLRQVSFCLVFCTRAQMFFHLVSEFVCKNTGFVLG